MRERARFCELFRVIAFEFEQNRTTWLTHFVIDAKKILRWEELNGLSKRKVLIVGVPALGLITLPIAQFPNIAPPEVQVLATYVGADAQTLEQAVANRRRHQLAMDLAEINSWNTCTRRKCSQALLVSRSFCCGYA